MTLNQYLPTEEEKEAVHTTRDFLLGFFEEALNKQGIDAKVMAVGSTAKDTFVKGDMDIDIFVVSADYKKAYEFFKRKIPEGRRKEGPMDIWYFIYRNYDVDLVCIPPDHPRIETLVHTAFMNRNLTPRLKEEAIRAKAFFKSKGVYGAEIGGIVGIAVEELIRRHKTIEKTCQVLLSSAEIPFIEDPANPKRNILASIKPVRWKQLQESCRKLLETKHFKYKTYTSQEFLRQRKTWTHLPFERKRDRATDFHTALSVCNHVLNEIRNREPEVEGGCDAYVFENIIVSYDVSPKELSKNKIYCGPPVTMESAVEAFKFVHPENFEEKGKICTIIERDKTDVVAWMHDLITDRMQSRGYLPL